MAVAASPVAFASSILFAHDDLPVFLLAVFAKNERANLSSTEFTTLATLAALIVKTYGKEPE